MVNLCRLHLFFTLPLLLFFNYSQVMNALGLALSFLYIILVIAVGVALKFKTALAAETIRKIIHIGVSSWWFFYLLAFDSLTYALIGPISFVVLNSVAVFSGFASILGIHSRRRNLGLIYFPISFIILILLVHYQVITDWAATIGALAMGFGDGFAALVGTKWGARSTAKGRGTKSLLGATTMFVVTAAVVFVTTAVFQVPDVVILRGLTVALFATVLEFYTPWGLDNLSVPLLTALVATFLL